MQGVSSEGQNYCGLQVLVMNEATDPCARSKMVTLVGPLDDGSVP